MLEEGPFVLRCPPSPQTREWIWAHCFAPTASDYKFMVGRKIRWSKGLFSADVPTAIGRLAASVPPQIRLIPRHFIRLLSSSSYALVY